MLAGAVWALALLATPAGALAANPPENLPLGALPAACSNESSAECEHWMVARLDAAHAALGLESYKLPGDFTSLSPDRQILILADLDRLAYGYTPVSGLNAALDEAASKGVHIEDDPLPPSTEAPWDGFGSDWADTGALRSYYLWMYDDGWQSPNLDCTSPSAAGCWGHRHVILGEGLSLPQPEVLGFATGTSLSGEAGSALIISSHPGAATYYTWAQAQSEGAGAGEGRGSEGSEGPGGGETHKGEEGHEEGKHEGSEGEGSKGNEGAEKPAVRCVRLTGGGHVGSGDGRVNVSEQLATSSGSLQRLEALIHTAHGWQTVRLRHLEESSCAARGAGWEFRGRASATLGGTQTVTVTFAFFVSHPSATVSLEVSAGGSVLYQLSETAFASGSWERVTLESESEVRQSHTAAGHHGKAHRALRRTTTFGRAARVEDLHMALRRHLKERKVRVAEHDKRR